MFQICVPPLTNQLHTLPAALAGMIIWDRRQLANKKTWTCKLLGAASPYVVVCAVLEVASILFMLQSYHFYVILNARTLRNKNMDLRTVLTSISICNNLRTGAGKKLMFMILKLYIRRTIFKHISPDQR